MRTASRVPFFASAAAITLTLCAEHFGQVLGSVWKKKLMFRGLRRVALL
jgi:hypothetical protein